VSRREEVKRVHAQSLVAGMTHDVLVRDLTTVYEPRGSMSFPDTSSVLDLTIAILAFVALPDQTLIDPLGLSHQSFSQVFEIRLHEEQPRTPQAIRNVITHSPAMMIPTTTLNVFCSSLCGS
jgi:hypothetical protein